MAEMTCITAPNFTDPSSYQISQLPRPAITAPTDVVIKVHAASINPIDVKLASGAFQNAGLAESFPMKIGYDCAGVVTGVGDGVKALKVGDEVYSRLPDISRGAWGEYVKASEDHVALKPKSLSFGDAASLPLAACTAMQALRKYRGDSLEGKTVFVPAGLGGTGAFACQLAKNVFGAGKVITTVSTSKIDKLGEYLGENTIDQVIDYTKEDPMKVIHPQSVDFILDTLGQAMQYLSLMTPKTGTIVSISTTPSGSQLQDSSFFKRPSNPRVPWLVRLALDGMDYVRKLRAKRWSVNYQYMFLESSGKELDILTKYVGEKNLLPVVGLRVDIHDLDKVKEACNQVYHGKGGIGKTVFEIVRS